MKKRYETIMMQIDKLSEEEIITASGTPTEHDNDFKDFFDDLF